MQSVTVDNYQNLIKIGSVVYMKIVTHGEAVYNRKGQVINRNSSGVISEYYGVVREVKPEGTVGLSAIKVYCDAVMPTDCNWGFYPHKIDNECQVKLLSDDAVETKTITTITTIRKIKKKVKKCH